MSYVSILIFSQNGKKNVCLCVFGKLWFGLLNILLIILIKYIINGFGIVVVVKTLIEHKWRSSRALRIPNVLHVCKFHLWSP